MKMLEVTILNHFNKIDAHRKALPTLNSEPSFTHEGHSKIYLGMHAYSTSKSALFPKINS